MLCVCCRVGELCVMSDGDLVYSLAVLSSVPWSSRYHSRSLGGEGWWEGEITHERSTWE